ncbi:hypothetical protein ACHAWF_010598 [Thalassiosira exigua]
MKRFSAFALPASAMLLLLPALARSFSVRSPSPFSASALARRSTAALAVARRSAPPAGAAASPLSSFSSLPSTGPAGSTTARFLSSPSSPDTSVVETCRSKISAALETDDVKVIGAYDDPNGSHISVEVVSTLFEGKRPVQRQQLVYKALWEELQGAVHAVDSMVCKTPDEAK